MSNNHKLEWEQRNVGIISGVEDVLSFEMDKVVLATSMGTLTIMGKDFKVKYFSVEKNEICLNGTPTLFKYSTGIQAKGKNTWSRLLK